MAGKKATCYILNVNQSMSLYPDEAFQKAVDTISCSLQDRALIGRKTDYVSVLLCGTPGTHNILAADTPGQYQHITALSDFQATDVDLLKKLSNLTTKESEEPGDILDALIVACKMMVDFCKHLKYIKQISIFTDAKDEIDWNDLDFVAENLKSNNIALTLIGVGYDQLDSSDCPKNIRTNYENWKKLIKASSNEAEEEVDSIFTIEEAYQQTQMIYTKEIRSTPSFRGYLYLGRPEVNDSFAAISINMYLRTKEVRLPSAKKVSGVSQSGERKVQMLSKFMIDIRDEETSEMVEKEVIKENIQKGYKFGKSTVIISEEEMAVGRDPTKKEMTIIGYLDANKFPRHYLYSNAYIITAGAYRPTESALAIATMAQSLFEKNRYALVRYVPKDNGAPRIGILQPELDERAPVLQYFDVPFADDIRDYKFRNVKKSKTVSQEGYDLMDDLIDRMNLDSLGDDYLAPEQNFNPITYRLNKAIVARALNEKSTIPDIDPRFSAQLQRRPDIEAKIDGLGKEIAEFFGVKKVRDKGKKRTFGQAVFDNDQNDETASISDMINAANAESRSLPGSTNPDSLTSTDNKALIIGTATPIDDYKKLLVQEGDEDNVEIANNLLREVILKLMESSFRNQHYPKICDCLEVMRETCAKEDEASTYNKFMHEIKAWIDTKNTTTTRYELWTMLKDRKLGLITNEECLDTDTRDVTKEVAEKFWQDEKDEVDVSRASAGYNSDDDKFDADDLEDLF